VAGTNFGLKANGRYRPSLSERPCLEGKRVISLMNRDSRGLCCGRGQIEFPRINLQVPRAVRSALATPLYTADRDLSLLGKIMSAERAK